MHPQFPAGSSASPKPSNIDNRRVRFANLPAVARGELMAAAEMWLDDCVRAPWATREAMRLAAHIINHILAGNGAALSLREMETALQLSREDVNRAFGVLRLFRAITAYTVEKDDVQATLHLSSLQMLRLVELRKRQLELLAPRG